MQVWKKNVDTPLMAPPPKSVAVIYYRSLKFTHPFFFFDPREIKHSFHSALLVCRCQLESQRPSTTVPSASCVGSSSSTAAGGFGSPSSLLRSFTPGRGHETEEKPAHVAVGQWRIKTWEQSCGRRQTTLWPGPPQLQSWVWSAKMFKHTHCAWPIIVILCGFKKC